MKAPDNGEQIDAGVWLKTGVIALWSFWALFSLVTPVTIFDSNTYNLARVELAWKGGLFGNPYWNDERQICFPWTFDALHLPFLGLGFGAALPSFACFTGLLLIVFRLVAERFGRGRAWWCCLALLALPTLVYQATSTKNDVVVVFALAAWAYALDRFHRHGERRYLWLMGLALAFAAGSKSSGLPLALVLGMHGIWDLRRSARAAMTFSGACVLGLILWGSLETYANNLRVFGHLLGAPSFIQAHTNSDGIKGAAANFIRYLLGNTSIGVDSIDPNSGFIRWTESVYRTVFRALGWQNIGYFPGYSDRSLRFLKDGWEASSDFGPLGGLALWFALGALVLRWRRDVVWKLSALSVGSLLLVCFTTAWMPWNSRFLLIPFILATIALVLAVLAVRRIFLRIGLLIVILFSALVVPCFSLNKNPAGLWAAIRDRRAFTLRERPTMLDLVNDLDVRVRSGELTHLAVCARSDSWILPLFSIPGLTVDPVPEPGGLAAAVRMEKRTFVLLLGRTLPASSIEGLRFVRSYPEPDSALYRPVQ